MSPYFCRNLPTRAMCLLALPMTSRTGSSCFRLMGKSSAIQHLPVSRRACFGFFFLLSSTSAPFCTIQKRVEPQTAQAKHAK